jgi:hypothetical protein
MSTQEGIQDTFAYQEAQTRYLEAARVARQLLASPKVARLLEQAREYEAKARALREEAARLVSHAEDERVEAYTNLLHVGRRLFDTIGGVALRELTLAPLTLRISWKAVVSDIDQLPRDFLEPSMPKLNRMARRLGPAMAVPGVKIEPSIVFALRDQAGEAQDGEPDGPGE